MKLYLFLLSLVCSQTVFANPTLNCTNQDGKIQLIPTKGNGTPAFNFIGGEGNLASGIPVYEKDLPGYIDFDSESSAKLGKDVIFLLDGGTWTITMAFPKGYLSSNPAKGTTVKATMDSSYDDINQDELNGIDLDCTVE